ncbi:zinc ribbon domain-containing protein [Bacillaceae bacterium S4-13-58]
MQHQHTIDKKVIPMLKEVPSQPLQEVFFRLEKAYEKFFRKEAKYPKLKKYTSVECSDCGHHVKKSLSVRTHVCMKCGLIMDRDENATRNILHRAKEELYPSAS